jgi:type VI secretion system protein ImpH
MSTKDAISAAPQRYSFFDVLRLLERTRQDLPRIGLSGARDEEIAILGQSPFVEFPASNLDEFGIDPQNRFVVRSRFLGMLGPQGALPMHTTYEARHRADMRAVSFARFLDVFNHRFQQLFFRAWADARPAAQFDRPDEDRFAFYVGAAVGIGTASFRHRDSLDDMAKLAVSGLLSPAVKSASRLRGMITYLFKANVEIEQFVGMWLPLERGDQTSIGGLNSRLGEDVMLGASVYSLQDKFRIKIRARTLDEFQKYLPDGEHCVTLADAVSFYLGDLLAYEVELGLPDRETRPTQLGSFGRLGWTSWMKQKDRTSAGNMRWDCRFHPNEIRGESSSADTTA